ncbi:hypothetical protein ACJIZ3_009373 [Penstemon smallii]|uniref:Aquaporin TIP5-1 n=1 Tax=Penstemon smallii TaxID=265156 RepID=A0ABD3TEA9_9LAMI
MASLKSRLEHSVTPIALRAYFAEYISTFLFVYASVGAAILVAIAVANAFAMSVAVYLAANISGGHVNPAVTFGMTIGGHITIPMAIFYWIAQMLGSVMACLLLKTSTVAQQVPVHAIPHEMTGFGAAILEGVMTFALVYTVYASADPRRGAMGAIGPLAIGFIVGANVLASGPFTGGSMNPALSFGTSLIGGSFKNQAVYWIGPMIGAAVAGILYDNVVFPAEVPISDGIGV